MTSCKRNLKTKLLSTLPLTTRAEGCRTAKKYFKLSQKTLEMYYQNRKNYRGKNNQGSVDSSSRGSIRIINTTGKKKLMKKSTSNSYLHITPNLKQQKKAVNSGKKIEWKKNSFLKSGVTRKLEVKLDSMAKTGNPHVKILN
ncbi:unnamed protein product [Moneuplotes crassus]|uniref:Uncharacterized protein n=1 Tax=Euplotes crassus TaxID=5936 RepID=A0AAD1U2R6_EUPCR|nr:unnamed protein product [Moneuplotes crassus]